MIWPTPPLPFRLGGGIGNAEHWVRATGSSPNKSSGVWSSANLAVYTPCWTPQGFRAGHIGAFHGSAVSGNEDIGIYLPDAEGKPGAALFRAGSAAMSGTNQVTINNTPNHWIPPGLFYLAYALDNTTGQVIRLAVLTNNGQNYQASIFTQAAAFPLPATATPSKTPIAVNVPLLYIGTL